MLENKLSKLRPKIIDKKQMSRRLGSRLPRSRQEILVSCTPIRWAQSICRKHQAMHIKRLNGIGVTDITDDIFDVMGSLSWIYAEPVVVAN
ncbi:hypothetical protein O2N63_13000 [Aliiroseovarius sp. KMU-50]|uniref:Uncharacterized protein n=1 Tax=Aliiroseovarius salicola TaxID=3009082 RepID=A0ABT4W3D3_9RHOB|nr:hypothetical protein [Aliiroseovarius sp. KMU-50]MDA5095001.1 hypothetical protein [Aliiroseovarius sp. KMU-50]